MRIIDLVNNPMFPFNAPFRITHLVVGATEELDKRIVLYDSKKSFDLPFDLALESIAEIRAGADGILEIDID